MSTCRITSIIRNRVSTKCLTACSSCSHTLLQSSSIHTSAMLEQEAGNRRWWQFKMIMSNEDKKQKEQNIELVKKEEAPRGMLAKVKYYIKRYWYIAVPAHMMSCSAWFASLFLLVQSGIDVVLLLETLHLPESVISTAKNVSPTTGSIVVTVILYKIAVPLRYATTLVLIQSTFWFLRRAGRLSTACEVEYKVRTAYEKDKIYYGRKWIRFRSNKKVYARDVLRRNSLYVRTQLRRNSTYVRSLLRRKLLAKKSSDANTNRPIIKK